MDKSYFDDKGNYIEEFSDGHVFINGSCVCEPCSDSQCDRYAVDVMNGSGFYNSDGHFVRYSESL